MPYIPRGHDPFFVPNPDPTRHYRWIADDVKRLALWTRSYGSCPGYELVTGTTPDETVAKARELGLPADYVDRAFNRIRYGNNFLASIPIEEYHRRRAEFIQAAITRVRDAESGGPESLNAMRGVKAYVREAEELQDRASHARREDRPFVSLAQTAPPKPARDRSGADRP